MLGKLSSRYEKPQAEICGVLLLTATDIGVFDIDNNTPGNNRIAC